MRISLSIFNSNYFETTSHKTILFFSFLLTSNNESKEIIIGNLKSYNLKVIVETDPKKKTEEISFRHIIKERIYFRLKTQILATEIIDVENLDGYVLSGINELKSKKQKLCFNYPVAMDESC